jgi:hypothetical protein
MPTGSPSRYRIFRSTSTPCGVERSGTPTAKPIGCQCPPTGQAGNNAAHTSADPPAGIPCIHASHGIYASHRINKPMHTCFPPALVPYFLPRMLWGGAALGEQPAPPHTAPSMPAAGGGRCGPGLLVCLPACRLSPVHHWPGCRLAIYYRALVVQLAALVAVASAAPIPTGSVIPKQIVTKCNDHTPTTTLQHPWRHCTPAYCGSG